MSTFSFRLSGGSDGFTFALQSVGATLVGGGGGLGILGDAPGGEYLSYNLTGHDVIVLTNLSGPNAVLSGIFFSPPAATYIGSDSTTQGNWQSNHGSDGYYISQGPNSIPNYATFDLYGQSNYVWAQNNGDPRNLNLPAGGTLAGTWYSATSMTIILNFTDNQPHRFSAYFLDWDNQGRAIQAQVTDIATGQILSTQTITDFAGGKYVSWNLSGHVQITLTPLAAPNVVLSGVFFGS